MAPSIPVVKTGNVQGSQLDMFESCELTGTGCAMSTAHGLGHTPTKVWATLTEAASAVNVSILKGVPTNINVVYTVVAAAKYIVYAV